MHYKLIGFSQHDSVRSFMFEEVQGNGASSAAFTVVADLAAARKFRITLQELPALCSRLLASRADDQPAGIIILTDEDLKVHAAANVASAREEETKRLLRSRRAALAAAARTENQNTSGETRGPDLAVSKVIS